MNRPSPKPSGAKKPGMSSFSTTDLHYFMAGAECQNRQTLPGYSHRKLGL